jgi:phospholipid/cholesterol/gamma-HCH transport system ATP-binding protein
VVLVTSSSESLCSIADRMIFLDGETHRPVAIGSPAELARSADSRKVRDFLARRGGVSTKHTEAGR